MSYTCYTDGSALWNPWPWWRAWVVIENEAIVTKWSWWNTWSTNNRMELQAVIELLQSFVPWYKKSEQSLGEGLFSTEKRSSTYIECIRPPLIIYTDSTYVQKWITERIAVWIQRNRRRSKWWKLVANVELWKELHSLVWYFESIQWIRTKAHVGTKRNEWVDSEARKQAVIFSKKMSR